MCIRDSGNAWKPQTSALPLAHGISRDFHGFPHAIGCAVCVGVERGRARRPADFQGFLLAIAVHSKHRSLRERRFARASPHCRGDGQNFLRQEARPAARRAQLPVLLPSGRFVVRRAVIDAFGIGERHALLVAFATRVQSAQVLQPNAGRAPPARADLAHVEWRAARCP